MKNILLLFVFTCTSFGLFGQKAIDLNNFDALKVTGNIEVELIPSDKNQAQVTVHKGDLNSLEIQIKGSTLVIKQKSKNGINWNNELKASIVLHYQKIREIDVAAGGIVKSDYSIESNGFSASASSGGKIEIELVSTNVNIDVSSGGNADISGSTVNLNVEASSGGHLDASNLKSMQVVGNASSGGHAKIWAIKDMKATVSSGGKIRYRGDPEEKVINEAKYSGGKVVRI